MSRVFAGFLVLLTAMAVAPAAPRPKETPKPFHPVTRGDCWVYDDDGVVETCRVTKVTDNDGAIEITVESSRPDFDAAFVGTLEVRDRGLYRKSGHSIEFSEPICLLQFPPKADDTWTDSLTNPKYEGTNTVFGPEMITVPAGSFMAYRVESAGKLDGSPTASTAWFASGVGLVKMVYDKGKIQTLKSFTPGKQ